MGEGGDPRILTVAEVNALLPRVEAILQEMDGHLARSREWRDLLEDLERYWGPAVHEPGHPDHAEHVRLHAALQDALAAVEACARRIHDLGGHLKSVEAGLVDFYSERGGRTVFLCWKRGEPGVLHYHDLEAGFAGRKPVAPE